MMAAKKKSTKTEKKSLEQTLTELRKEYGKEPFSDSSTTKGYGRTSSGIISVDRALGGVKEKGLAKGRLVEMFGPESCGKTSMAMQLGAQEQKAGGIVCYIDAEIAFDYDHAKNVGLQTTGDKFVLVQPRWAEEALEICRSMLDVEGIGLIIIDSVPALCPKAIGEGLVGDAHMGIQARMMSQFCTMIKQKLETSHCSVIFINQTRMKIGVVYGNPETTPGGNALKFYSSVRMRIKHTGWLGDKSAPIGMSAEMHVIKNKTGKPFRRAQYNLMFNGGFSKEADLRVNAVELGIIEQSGSWFSYTNPGKDIIKLGQGSDAVDEILGSNPELFKEIWDRVLTALDD